MESSLRNSLPALLSPSRQLSASHPFTTHGSCTAGNHKPPTQVPSNADGPFEAPRDGDYVAWNSSREPPVLKTHHACTDPENVSGAPREKHHRHLAFDPASLDPTKFRPRHKHKHSKSRDGRLPRIMNPIASSTSARGLLSPWSGGREKESDPDDGLALLRPVTRETTRSRWGSESTTGLGTGSRKGSIFDEIDRNNHLGLIRRQEIRSLDDLEQVRDKRKQGERYLRSALSIIGTLATDITRRLDYTYYNLLEKLAALHVTIASFQELSDSTSTLFTDFGRETTNLDHDIRKQIGELKDFQPQMQKIEALEERMKAGRMRAEALSCRLEEMRKEIDRWERKEAECQIRISRRLRIFWGLVTAGILTLAVALVVQNWIILESPESDMTSQAVTVTNGSTGALVHNQESGMHWLATDIPRDTYVLPQYPSKLISRHDARYSTDTATTTYTNPENARATEQDPLRMFDEL
ncbi:hypothetical protein ANOM_008379 [Aspergillus nomiae NRRL 13137]|uniref:Uncharacterized protein n=1 Tax=Aspergillus nomiae NRRL (strain ATCC 15546 / NRRL 13137 / CBS 260.88 / M93) TaxID=1509407 RepID=A0A0L1IX17_ASPN3|nr:uncharacterized protein ANOM_008379 [Aspergillus nomiae NRRL 13137]KNG84039.1 hypothetical protein ANOM_008379 [Aspergillus nomiae NRRL 13137]